MCGIFAIVDHRTQAVFNDNLIQRASHHLNHRGPDDEGTFVEPPVAMAHRRLSIIDIEGGHQPMQDSSGRYTIVYNGEIYNFPRLREKLEAEGVIFRTQSDTEVLVELYRQYGSEMLHHIRGMFAFAIWDSREKKLFAARDRLGQKPLFFYHKGSLLIVSSCIRSLLEHPEVGRSLDVFALNHFLAYNCIPAPRSMFENIQKLPPAHLMQFSREGLYIDRYWEPVFQPEEDMSEAEARAGVLKHLRQAVRMRLISDVPLGAFLSGGIDSSLMVALMSEVSGQKVRTFSIGFEEEGWSELVFARAVADRYRTDHREFVVKPDAIGVLPDLVQHFEEPFADSSALPVYYLARMTRQQVTVALNGDGGDESFAGYPRHLVSSWLDRYRSMPEPLREGAKSVFSMLSGDLPPVVRRLKRFNELSFLTPEEAYCAYFEIFPPDLAATVAGPAAKPKLTGHDARQHLLNLLSSSSGGSEWLGHLLYADLNAYLPDDLLVKMDRMTMAHGLEARSPMLDHHLIEFAARIPAKYKVRGFNQKILLKNIARDFVPSHVIDRPKQGFGVPMGLWLKNELKIPVEAIFLNSSLVREGWIDREGLNRLWNEHQAGQESHTHRLWGLLNLELWHRIFIEGKSFDREEFTTSYPR